MYITYNCNMEYLEIGNRNFKTKNIIYVSNLRGSCNSYYVVIRIKGCDNSIEVMMEYNIEQKDHIAFTEVMKKERNRLSYALRHCNFGDGIFFDKDMILNELYGIKTPQDAQ